MSESTLKRKSLDASSPVASTSQPALALDKEARKKAKKRRKEEERALVRVTGLLSLACHLRPSHSSMLPFIYRSSPLASNSTRMASRKRSGLRFVGALPMLVSPERVLNNSCV